MNRTLMTGSDQFSLQELFDAVNIDDRSTICLRLQLPAAIAPLGMKLPQAYADDYEADIGTTRIDFRTFCKIVSELRVRQARAYVGSSYDAMGGFDGTRDGLGKSKSPQRRPSQHYAVFLGGACNPTTWRRDTAMPMLESAGISYYNPQVEHWTPELIAVESAAKEHADVLLIVVGIDTRAIASMIECAEYIARKRDVVVVLEDVPPNHTINGELISEAERKDLNRGRAYLADVSHRHGNPIFTNVIDALQDIIDRHIANKSDGAVGRQ